MDWFTYQQVYFVKGILKTNEQKSLKESILQVENIFSVQFVSNKRNWRDTRDLFKEIKMKMKNDETAMLIKYRDKKNWKIIKQNIQQILKYSGYKVSYEQNDLETKLWIAIVMTIIWVSLFVGLFYLNDTVELSDWQIITSIIVVGCIFSSFFILLDRQAKKT
jgi:cell division protein FtsX